MQLFACLCELGIYFNGQLVCEGRAERFCVKELPSKLKEPGERTPAPVFLVHFTAKVTKVLLSSVEEDSPETRC